MRKASCFVMSKVHISWAWQLQFGQQLRRRRCERAISLLRCMDQRGRKRENFDGSGWEDAVTAERTGLAEGCRATERTGWGPDLVCIAVSRRERAGAGATGSFGLTAFARSFRWIIAGGGGDLLRRVELARLARASLGKSRKDPVVMEYGREPTMQNRTASSLEELRTKLRAKFPVAAVFTAINTRLIIATGVNLKKIDADQNRDPRLLAEVSEALRKMDIDLFD